ncbi:MAG: DUF2996 domain-containing protein [Cyanobacteria bacterium P01_C01_bin.89]
MADEKENKVAESPESPKGNQTPALDKAAQVAPEVEAKAEAGDAKDAPKQDGKGETAAKGEEKAKAKPADSKEEPKAAKKKEPAEKAEEKKDAPAKKPAAKKKAKPPKLEDKPFNEFMKEHYLPELEKVLAEQGIDDLTLSFVKEPVAVGGLPGAGLCSQVVGNWFGGDREFRVYFPKDDIKGIKTFSYAETGSSSSILESFLIDERKITLDLLVSGVVLRLQAQKWIGRN